MLTSLRALSARPWLPLSTAFIAALFTFSHVLQAESYKAKQYDYPKKDKPMKHPSDSSAAPSKCPVTGVMQRLKALAGNRHTAAASRSNRDWWPEQLNLSILRQNAAKSNPLGKDFDYAKAFNSLDMDELKKDITKVLKTSQDWWPADWGHYGPFIIRMAWHSAGTYRVSDGRGGAGYGTLRFAPLNSWPDNANLDKARRLLWPIKQKYGQKISWADLMILSGNVALEDMGLKPFGFAGGREDVWEAQEDIYWGPESKWLDSKRHDKDGKLEEPLAADEMGLIYVNPQGPGGKPDPLASAKRIRETFGQMAMNDEETVALIAGGHTFGKAHGAASEDHKGAEPEGASIEAQGFGWTSNYGKGNAEDTITSGLEGAWTSTPTQWSNEYFDNLFEYDWELTKSPAGAWQWHPKDGKDKDLIPDAHVKGKSSAPMMFTTDLALIKDPAYRKVSRHFYNNPKAFEEAFARAWYKLTHRDMGPVARLLGEDVAEPQLWQDPVPAVDHKLVDETDIRFLKKMIENSDLTEQQLISTAWASASTYRGTDKRGGANGARIRLAPQKDWSVNQPEQLAKVLEHLTKIQSEFNQTQTDGTKISMADLIVLAGGTAVEAAAQKAGHEVSVPFAPGRTDATKEMTDTDSFDVLEPKIDGFRNFVDAELDRSAAEHLIDRAHKLTLTAPEMTVLLGGLRVLNINTGGEKMGVFTDRPGQLSNDFFVNLLSMDTKWQKAKDSGYLYEGLNRDTGKVTWTATSVDLIFGSNSELRALAEVYASDDGKEKFVHDFVKTWTKVMQLDRFDLKEKKHETKLAMSK